MQETDADQTGHKGEPWSIWQWRRRRTVRDSFLECSSDTGLSWKTLDPLWPLDTLGSVKHQANIIIFSSTVEHNHQWLYKDVPVSHGLAIFSTFCSNSISPPLTWECSFPESSKNAVGTGESSDKMSLTLISLELACSPIYSGVHQLFIDFRTPTLIDFFMAAMVWHFLGNCVIESTR